MKNTFNLTSPALPKETYIREMFDRMARRYDLFTQLTGFGQAKRMRHEALKNTRAGMRVLDLGCGTGDLALDAAGLVGPQGESVGLDFSSQMLQVARLKYERIKNTNIGPLTLVLRKAEDLPLDERPFDLVVSGFVLRNLYENIERILDGVYRSLKIGGRIAFLDLTQPKDPFLAALFRLYFVTIVGLYGAALFGKDYPIPYLPDSAKRFFKADEFVEALRRAGFQNISARPFILGSVTLYEAQKI